MNAIPLNDQREGWSGIIRGGGGTGWKKDCGTVHSELGSATVLVICIARDVFVMPPRVLRACYATMA